MNTNGRDRSKRRRDEAVWRCDQGMLTMRRVTSVFLIALLFLGNGTTQSQPPSPSDGVKTKPVQQKPTASEKQTAPDQRGTEQIPLVIKGIPAEKTPEQAKEDKAERDIKTANERGLTLYTGFLALFTFGLIVVGSAQVGLFIWQLRLIRQSLSDTRIAADAAKQSAQAALETAEAITLSERAYVTISHRPPGVKIMDEGGLDIEVRVKNYGRTPANVTYVVIDATLLEPGELLPQDFNCRTSEHNPSGFLVHGGYFFHKRTLPLRKPDVPDVKSGIRTLWVFGYVDYIDSFKQRHRASYVRKYNPHIDDGKTNNLFYSTERRYNYDRKRDPGEGNDWD